MDMDVITTFCALRMGLKVLTVVRRENKVLQVVHKYLKDPIHEHGLKVPHRPYKKDLLFSSRIWEPIEVFHNDEGSQCHHHIQVVKWRAI